MDFKSFVVDYVLVAGYWIFGLALVATVAGFIYNTVINPQSIVKPAIAIVAIVILFFIGYSLATGQEYTIKSGIDTIVIGPEISKYVGGGLMVFYILLGIALVSVVFNEVSKFFK